MSDEVPSGLEVDWTNRVLIECVPNFSEGRAQATINKIAQAVTKSAGVDLLDIDIGFSANRTVMTFVGEPESVLEGAFQAIAVAAQSIDMKVHQGSHPRLGATDVCPFVPLTNATIDDCIRLSERLGARVAAELEIPVYLYAAAAKVEERRKLSWIRRGQYEGLASRIIEEGFLPDYSAKQFNEKSGATIIGARALLIAYNITLDSQSVSLANAIASTLRKQRDPKAENYAAIGWYDNEYNCAQVSMNLIDWQSFSLSKIFQTVVGLAAEFGVKVAHSEIIGLTPLKSLLDAGRHFLSEQGKEGIDEQGLIDTAIRSLKLFQSQRRPFDPEKKIIEYRLKTLGYGLNKNGFLI